MAAPLHLPARLGIAAVCLLAGAAAAHAQDPPAPEQRTPVAEVLSFLLTNQAVATGDFVKDTAATAIAADAVARLLQAELTTLPLGSSSAGFTYVMLNGPMPCTWTMASPSVQAKWRIPAGSVTNAPTGIRCPLRVSN